MDDRPEHDTWQGLSLTPMRALRPNVDSDRLGSMLCPPYDVIDETSRSELLRRDPDNAVAVILPEPTPGGYSAAAQRLDTWVRDGVYAVDEQAALFVYEMRDASGHITRGLLGALELRDPADGVVLPHENTMAGPVADRLQVMTSTGTDLEPIYLVYDGGGPASQLVDSVSNLEPIAHTITPDGVEHRLWALFEPGDHHTVAEDLATRRALIADGHHRYATYRERQRIRHGSDGAGPWDRGLTLLVDSSDYGPAVHAIHRVIPGLQLDNAVQKLAGAASVTQLGATLDEALADLGAAQQFAVVLTDGSAYYRVTDTEGELARKSRRPGEPAALAGLDVTIVHRGLVEGVWGVVDDVDSVRYAHSASEAVSAARETDGIALLLRPTPVAAVAAVAAAGARMPRKSTLFTPKPASGLVMRRLADQYD